MHGRAVELTRCATAFDAEHLVGLADVDDEWGAHEVCSEGNLGGLVPALPKSVLQKAGVEHDVAMIRHKEITLLWVKTVNAIEGESGSATSYDLFVDATHDFVLEVADVGELSHEIPHGLNVLSWVDVLCKQREMGIVSDAMHGCGYLGVEIWTYVIEVFHCMMDFMQRLYIYGSGINLSYVAKAGNPLASVRWQERVGRAMLQNHVLRGHICNKHVGCDAQKGRCRGVRCFWC